MPSWNARTKECQEEIFCLGIQCKLPTLPALTCQSNLSTLERTSRAQQTLAHQWYHLCWGGRKGEGKRGGSSLVPTVHSFSLTRWGEESWYRARVVWGVVFTKTQEQYLSTSHVSTFDIILHLTVKLLTLVSFPDPQYRNETNCTLTIQLTIQ